MPVVINRSDPGGSGGKGAKPDKAKASSATSQAKPAPSKGGKAAAGSTGAGMDEKKKIIALSAVIVLSLIIVLYMTGVISFGGGAGPQFTNNGPAVNPENAPKIGVPAPDAGNGNGPNPAGAPGKTPGGAGMLPQAGPGGIGAQQGTELGPGNGNSAGNGIN